MRLDDTKSKSGSAWAGETADSVEEAADVTTRYRGFTTNWGPVGFRKSAHPLSIMVGTCTCMCVCVFAERSEANKCAEWHLALRMYICIYICVSVTFWAPGARERVTNG